MFIAAFHQTGFDTRSFFFFFSRDFREEGGQAQVSACALPNYGDPRLTECNVSQATLQDLDSLSAVGVEPDTKGLVQCCAWQWFFVHLKMAWPEPGAIQPQISLTLIPHPAQMLDGLAKKPGTCARVISPFVYHEILKL